MKCLCGNKHLEDWGIDRELNFCGTKQEKQKLKEENGQEFIKLEGDYFHKENYCSHGSEISLYICPKCGTIKASGFGE